MQAALLGKLALLPVFFLGFALVGGWGAWAFAATLALALAGTVAFRRLGRDPVIFFLAGLATLVVWTLQAALNPPPPLPVAALLAALGAGMLASVALRRPWTVALSAGQSAPDNPLFLQINAAISALWGVIFLVNSLLVVSAAPVWAIDALVAGGIAVSILLPPFRVRRVLGRRLAEGDPYPWAPPEYGRATDDADVVVVGAGLGGLTAAALLAEAGLRVIVCEQHALPGGFAHHWRRRAREEPGRPAFRFDGGVHDFSGVQPGGVIHGLLARLGVSGAVRWLPMTHAKCDEGGCRAVPQGWDAFVADLCDRLPAEREALTRALGELRTMFTSMYAGAAGRSGFPGAPASVAEMLRFGREHPLAARWLQRPFTDFVAAHGLSADARAALLELANYVTDDPATLTVGAIAPIFGYHIHGGFYPEGGSGQLAAVLVEVIGQRGGKVRLRRAVAEVLVETGAVAGVRLASGETIRAPAVVMNADLLRACRELVDEHQWPEEFRQRLAATQPACSAFMLHLGVCGDFPGLPPILQLQGGTAVGIGIVLPGRVDAGVAPPGYTTVEIVRLLPQAEAADWFAIPDGVDLKAWRESPQYRDRKRMLGDELIALAETALPGLSERIVLREEASPLTFQRYAQTSMGSIYGVVGAAASLAPKSPLRGLVFAGAATIGPGAEAAVISGGWAAEALLPGLLAIPVASGAGA